MLINYRILYVRVELVAKRPRKNWPRMPAGVLFCTNGRKTVQNVFIKRSGQADPPLPVILLWPERGLSANFYKARTRLADIAIDGSFTNEFELGAVRETKIPNDAGDIAETLFARFVRKHPRHRDRKNLFQVSYGLGAPQKRITAKPII
jgi:hypothetical protein